MITKEEERELILKLRDQVVWSYMDCQRALLRNKWDLDKALAYLNSPEWRKGKI